MKIIDFINLCVLFWLFCKGFHNNELENVFILILGIVFPGILSKMLFKNVFFHPPHLFSNLVKLKL